MRRLLSTEHVADMIRANPNRHLVCRVDYAASDAIYLYLGDKGPIFDSRIGFYRVTPDGRCWINRDPTALDDLWSPID